MKGFINIIKPQGMSSAYAVGAVKRKFNMPCGHMGTLDPMASGVLPVGLGKATRLFDYLLDKKKTYVATFRFGVLTDTLDTTGTVTATCDKIPTSDEILSVLPRFVGEIEQVPPLYSAKCVDGKRGYQLARQGVDFKLPAKKVTILNIELLGQKGEADFDFKIECKGGTYIRSICRDLAYSLSTYATMTSLEREKSGCFTKDNAFSLANTI
jgi:tRNA pseudouridine55 synthase